MEVDTGDVRVLRGWLNELHGEIALLRAYDLDGDIDDPVIRKRGDATEHKTIEGFLASTPDFLKLDDPDKLVEAKAAYLAALDDYIAAIDAMSAETDLQEDDLLTLDAEGDLSSTTVDTGRDAAGTTDFASTTPRAILVELRDSIENGATPLPNLAAETHNDGALSADLQTFFAGGLDPRGDGLLPEFVDNDPVDGTLPDETLGGVVSGADWDDEPVD